MTAIPGEVAPPGALRRLRRIRHYPSLIVGLAMFLPIVLGSIIVPILSPHGATEQQPGRQLLAPSSEYLFGTDIFGMDIMTRTFAAARYDLGIAIVAAFVGMAIGVAIGALVGYVGGKTDEILSRIIEALQAFPAFIIALAVLSVLGSSVVVLGGVIALVQLTYYVRTMRAQALSLRERAFVESARAIGLPTSSILVRHIVPNGVRPLIIQVMINVGDAILLISLLGFLGLGTQVPTPEWGSMISIGLESAVTGEWWVWVFPGGGIILTVVSLNLIGDGLRDVLDPRQGG
jgi:peptide/nickel transport system permease protein